MTATFLPLPRQPAPRSQSPFAAAAGKGAYRSCHWIEGGLFVIPGGVRVCCTTNSVLHATGALRVISTSPDRLSVPAILEAKRRLRIANQTADAPCQGCYLLKEADWAANPTGFDSVALGGYVHCNLACSYCVSYDTRPKERIPLSLLGVLEQLISAGALKAPATVNLGGGESTLYHEFDPIMRLCIEHGLSAVAFTNATIYSEVLAEGVGKGLFRVVCSVDSGTRETYLRIKSKDFFDRVWQNLARYAAANPDMVDAKYIFLNGNLAREDILGFIEHCRAAGVRRVMAGRNVFSIVEAQNSTPAEVCDAAAFFCALAKKHGITWACLGEFDDQSRRSIEQRVALDDARAWRYETPRCNDGYPEFVFGGSPQFSKRLQFALETGLSPVPLTLQEPYQAQQLPKQVVDWLRVVDRTRGRLHVYCPHRSSAALEGDCPNFRVSENGTVPLEVQNAAKLAVWLAADVPVDSDHLAPALRNFHATVSIDPEKDTVTSITFTERRRSGQLPGRRVHGLFYWRRLLSRIAKKVPGARRAVRLYRSRRAA